MTPTQLRRLLSALTVASLVALALAWLAPARPARAETAATFVVDVVGDYPDAVLGNGVCAIAGGGCSLRAAIQEANTWPGDDTITFSSSIPTPATFLLTRVGVDSNASAGDLDLTSNITINGRGAGLTIIDGNNLVTNDRVFEIQSGTVTLSGLTIQNGIAAYGAGIFAYPSATVAVLSSTISNNYATSDGGGIYAGGPLTLTNSTITNNTADRLGGGLYSDAPLTIQGGALTANTSDDGSGGGLYNADDGRVTNATIGGNWGWTSGAGIHNEGTLWLTGSTITGNRTMANVGDGAGVYNAGTWYARNSTLSGNRSADDGGGVFNTGTTYLYSVTIAGNSADENGLNTGTGAGVYTASGALNVINTLLIDNTIPTTLVYSDCVGAITSAGGLRISYAGGCAISGPWGAVDHNSIGPLANNGGPVLTHALLAGSQAINAAETPSGCVDWNWSQLATDQRGAPRYSGAWCDVGAFEYAASLPRVWLPLVVR
jgi:CSLREA domain-containing protein